MRARMDKYVCGVQNGMQNTKDEYDLHQFRIIAEKEGFSLKLVWSVGQMKK